MPARPTPTRRRPAPTGALPTAPRSTSAADAPGTRRLAFLALLVLAGACGRAEQDRADSAAIAAAVGPAVSPREILECPKDGKWRACSITKRLQDAGLVPHLLPDSARVPFLTPVGSTWSVAKVELRVFLYEDAAQADREASAIDPIRVAPRGGTHAWPAPATLVHSGNMIAVLLSENARQVERVQLALEAGPPQAEGAPARP